MLLSVLWRPNGLANVLRPLRTSSVAFSTGAEVKKPKTKASAKPKVTKEELKAAMPPRKPSSSFLRFFREHENKSDSTGIIPRAQAAGAAWQLLSAEEKTKYNIPPREWEEYRTKRDEWEATVNPVHLKAINDARKKAGKVRFRVKSEIPRASVSPFSYFLASFWKTHAPSDATAEDKRPTTVLLRARETWGDLSPEEKAPYIELRDKAVVAYKAAIAKKAAEVKAAESTL